jgi:hypothetical protein
LTPDSVGADIYEQRDPSFLPFLKNNTTVPLGRQEIVDFFASAGYRITRNQLGA